MSRAWAPDPTTGPRLQIRSQDTTCESMKARGEKPTRRRRSATVVFGLAMAALSAAALVFSLSRPKPGTDDSPTAASGFLPTRPNPAQPPGPAPEGMVWIPGGEFSMGSDVACESLCGLSGVTRDALPIHRVYVDGFWMDKTDVTNEKFQDFVNATGYITVAARAPTREEYPPAPPENLVPGELTIQKPPPDKLRQLQTIIVLPLPRRERIFTRWQNQ
jgi:formylglycine-generating enzyme required for sulfatase activity